MGLFWLKSLYELIPIGWHKRHFHTSSGNYSAASQPMNKHNSRKEREAWKSGESDPCAKPEVREAKEQGLETGNLGDLMMGGSEGAVREPRFL